MYFIAVKSSLQNFNRNHLYFSWNLTSENLRFFLRMVNDCDKNISMGNLSIILAN